MPAGNSLSCVVCAYNEASRIGGVLGAATDHPLIDEVIVVDDGSSDETADVLRETRGATVISYPQNRGKAYALAQGLAAVSSDFVMLLDADLSGLRPEHLSQLANPVLDGQADASLSLRSNSLALYRAIGLDFVSGERVAPMALFRDVLREMERIPPWSAEAMINALIIRERLRLAVVRWPEVCNVRKSEKLGRWRGAAEGVRMVRQAGEVLSPLGLVRQNLQLLKLAQPSPERSSGHAVARCGA